MVKGDLASLLTSSGDFTASTLACLADDTASTSAIDAAAVPVGGVWYLVRPINCGGVGVYDSGSAAQSGSRDAEIAASAGACP